MKILVTGATGLVGSAVVPFLAGGGHEVARLGRSAPGAGDIRWDPDAGVLEARALEGFDGVIHLAGENIATGRWNAAKKRRIKESRVRGTRLLAETLAGLERPPRVLVSASAVGFYGDRGDEELTERSPAGSGFLPRCAASGRRPPKRRKERASAWSMHGWVSCSAGTAAPWARC